MMRLTRSTRRTLGAAIGVACAAALVTAIGGSEHRTAPTGPALRLALLHAVGGEAEEGDHGNDNAATPGRRVVTVFRAGTRVAATAAKSPSPPTFGQPTIAGVGGWGFEADLRLDPGNANRVYMSSPDSGGSDTSWIWRSLDGGKTFKWVPAAAPLNGKVISCPGGGDTELAVDGAGRLYFNDLSLANFSIARSDDQGRTFPACNSTGVPDGGVDRQWYALDGDPTAGGILYLANDEVGSGNVQCGTTQVNNVLVIYRSPVVGAAGSTAGLQFGEPYRITQPGSCDEGIMGNDEVSPVASRTGRRGNARHPGQARLRDP